MRAREVREGRRKRDGNGISVTRGWKGLWGAEDLEAREGSRGGDERNPVCMKIP